MVGNVVSLVFGVVELKRDARGEMRVYLYDFEQADLGNNVIVCRWERPKEQTRPLCKTMGDNVWSKNMSFCKKEPRCIARSH